jgi:polysaccharide biosynthesis protein PslG
MKRGPVLIVALVLLLGVGLGIRLLSGPDRPGPTPDPVGTAGPPRTGALAVQIPLNPAELSGAELDQALDQAVRAGATEIAAGVTWWFVTANRAPDSYDWTAIDRLVDGARSRDLQVRLQLSGTPDAVHPDLDAPEADRIWYPPRTTAELDAWAGFVRDTVEHFRGRAESYEMWNEPNIADFWKPAPDPAEYAALLQRAYTAAKQADPQAQVVFGGLSHNDVGYLQAYYRAAGPDAARHSWWFDTLDVHPYTDGRSPDDTSPGTGTLGRYGLIDTSFAGLRLMKAAMDRQEGDTGKTIVVGEYGFTTTGTETAAPVDDRRRAYFLKRAFAIAGTLSFVDGISWYGFYPDSSNDPGWAIASPGSYDSWTLQALRDVGAGAKAPTVTLPANPRPGTEIRPVVTGAAAVEHTELWVDGNLAASGDGAAVGWPAQDFAGGRVQVVVYTSDHHAWPSAVVTVTTGG